MSDKAAIIVIAVVVAVFIILFMFGAAKVSKEADAREDAWLKEEWGDEVD